MAVLKWCDGCGGSIAGSEAKRARLIDGQLLCHECAEQDDDTYYFDNSDNEVITGSGPVIQSQHASGERVEDSRRRSLSRQSRSGVRNREKRTTGTKSNETAQGCVGCFIIFIVIGLIGTCMEDETSTPTDSDRAPQSESSFIDTVRSSVRVGSRWKITEEFYGARTAALFDHAIELALSGRTEAMGELYADGDVNWLTEGTVIEVVTLNRNRREPNKSSVFCSVISGPYSGNTIWLSWDQIAISAVKVRR